MSKLYYIYDYSFDIPRMPEPEMMPNDVKRLRCYREHTFNKRYYFVSERERMIYRYYIPEEYHPRPSERSWDKIYPEHPNGFVKEVYHKTNSKSKCFEMIPDSNSKKRVALTLNDVNLKQLIKQNTYTNEYEYEEEEEL